MHKSLWIGTGIVTLIIFGIVGYIVFPVFFGSSAASAPVTGLQKVAATMAFTDVTQAAGFTHVHHKPYLDPKIDRIMSWMASVGAAGAAGDYDNDGWVDLYVTDSHKGYPNHLYHNTGRGTFIDVAKSSGVADLNDDSGTSMDCIWGDYDNDGNLDLFVVKWGRDVLFHNNGDGSFTDITSRAFVDESGSPGSPWANGNAAIWVDYDGDGFLDIYVGNYFKPVDLWHLKTTRIMHDSFEKARNAGRNFMFHNNQDGTFTQTAPDLGLDDPGWTLSVGHGDINNDGWPDIYCANDFGTDQLFLNDGKGGFRNISESAFGEDTKKGMNAEFGDVDNDGWLDIYVTNITTAEYLKEGNMLWHNDASDAEGIPIFMDIALETGTQNGGWGWGGKFFDMDNDGDLDILTVNGFITAGKESYWYDLASWTVTGQDVSDALNWPRIGDRSFSGNEATRLFRNEGMLRFSEIAQKAGITSQRDGRGIVLFDYDNDGDLDVYLANQGMPPDFYRNNLGGNGQWLGLALTGRPENGSNRDAIGARVTIVTNSGQQIRELNGGNSYSAQSDRRLFFGLGDDIVVNTLEIRWPSGKVQVLTNVRCNQFLDLTESDDLGDLSTLIPTNRAVMKAHSTRKSPETVLPEAEIDELLSGFEENIRLHLSDLTLSSKYRIQCVKLGQFDRAIGFFEKLTNEYPSIRNPRLQLALAYIDKIPQCGGMAAIVCKGTLARKSLDQLDILLEADATWWPAIYARGMNHLHWPRALRHSDMAVKDLETCIAFPPKNEREKIPAYYSRAYIGLGDALTKGGGYPKALKVWSEGLRLFPGNADLGERLQLKSDAEAREFVEKVRNLDEQIDTDFSFMMLSP